MMNGGAVAEIAADRPRGGDREGRSVERRRGDEWAAFEACYRAAFGDRLHVVRGNHDAYHGQTAYAGDEWIDLPGLAIALLDTTIPSRDAGRAADGADRLARRQPRGATGPCCSGTTSNGCRATARAAATTTSACTPTERRARRRVRPPPDVDRYAAGHTHRHRVRRMAVSRRPYVEVGCVKDFPARGPSTGSSRAA